MVYSSTPSNYSSRDRRPHGRSAIARREHESGNNSDEHEVIRAETRYILEDPVDPVTGLPGPFYDDGSAATP
jgi:hypothetical protein